MFRKSVKDFGGKIFGTGVTDSSLYNFGQDPSCIDELIMSVRGTDNILINFGGISPGGTDLFTFTFSSCF